MASIKPTREGTWRVQVARLGVRDSETFATKREAEAWGLQREAEILAGKRGQVPRRLVYEILARYATEVSPNKKGGKWEVTRLRAMAREPFAQLWNKDVGPAHMAAWKDKRLREVSRGTVRREMNLVKAVFNLARREWGWLNHDPFEAVATPKNNPPRRRRVPPSEVRLVLRALGWKFRCLETKQQQLAYAWLLSLRSAMRQSEILGLNVDLVSLRDSYVVLEDTKNGDTMVDVPMPPKAMPLLRFLVAHAKQGKLFTLTSGSADTLFRRATVKAKVENLHFHDARAEAITWMVKVLRYDVLTVSMISRHKDLKTLRDTYYRESAAEIAARLVDAVAASKPAPRPASTSASSD